MTDMIAIVGTADFDPEKLAGYKLEISPAAPTDPQWTSFNSIYSIPVIDGTLGSLDAATLSPGDYLIRLVLVSVDGAFIGQPFTIRIRLE